MHSARYRNIFLLMTNCFEFPLHPDDLRWAAAEGGRAYGVYRVTQLLRPEGKVFRYRIKNINEPHESVAKESELRRV